MQTKQFACSETFITCIKVTEPWDGPKKNMTIRHLSYIPTGYPEIIEQMQPCVKYKLNLI